MALKTAHVAVKRGTLLIAKVCQRPAKLTSTRFVCTALQDEALKSRPFPSASFGTRLAFCLHLEGPPVLEKMETCQYYKSLQTCPSDRVRGDIQYNLSE